MGDRHRKSPSLKVMTPEDRPAPLRLAICLPWTDKVDAPFARCLAELLGMLGLTLVGDKLMEVKIFDVAGTYIDKSRRELTQAALKWDATHLLWLDSDMVFPPDIVHRLLARNVDIVAANYARRRPPHSPVTFKTLEPQTLCYTTNESAGLEAVAAIGFGVVLMRASIFAHEAMALPVFESFYDRESHVCKGEDVTFSECAAKAGLTIWIDHDVSKEVGHVGRFTYTNYHTNVINNMVTEAIRDSLSKVKVETPRLVDPEGVPLGVP